MITVFTVLEAIFSVLPFTFSVKCGAVKPLRMHFLEPAAVGVMCQLSRGWIILWKAQKLKRDLLL